MTVNSPTSICHWPLGCTPSVDGVGEPSGYTVDVYRRGIDQLAELGYDKIEAPHVGHLTECEAAQIGDHARSAGMVIASVHADICTGRDARKLAQYRHLHQIDVCNAAAMGARILVEHTTAEHGRRDADLDWERQRFDESARLAADHGLVTAIENGAADHEFVIRLVNACDPQTVGATLDVGHANLGAVPLARIVDAMMPRLVHIHIHDNAGDFDGHQPLGSGTIDWADVFNRLSQGGYDGVVIFEAASPYARSHRPHPPARELSLRTELKRTLDFYHALPKSS